MPYSWLTAACCLAVQYQIVRWQIASFVSLPPGLRAYGFGAAGSLMSRTCRQSPIQPSFGFTAGSVAFTSGVASTTCTDAQPAGVVEKPDPQGEIRVQRAIVEGLDEAVLVPLGQIAVDHDASPRRRHVHGGEILAGETHTTHARHDRCHQDRRRNRRPPLCLHGLNPQMNGAAMRKDR